MVAKNPNEPADENFKIGWASCEITPVKLPVIIAGQMHARLSEGVEDPLTGTALALASGNEQVVFVSADLVVISDELRDAVRELVATKAPGLDPRNVIINATHSHSAPEVRPDRSGIKAGADTAWDTPAGTYGPEDGFPVVGQTAGEYVDFAAEKLAQCAADAWKARKPGSVAFGLDYAVIGRNRIWVNNEGTSKMYGLRKPAAREIFQHVEGSEDHSVNVLATYGADRALTGVVINLACPSQESQLSFLLSADFWHEVRLELAGRLGKGVYILPQCSAAGDQTSQLIHGYEAHNRMLGLQGRTQRQHIAWQIAEAVERVLAVIPETAQSSPVLQHEVKIIDVPLARISPEQAQEHASQASLSQKAYEKEVARLKADPDLRKEPRWYVKATESFRRVRWYGAVKDRFDQQQNGQNLLMPVEVHVVRLGDMAFATNPFELYLDYGQKIKILSPFVQTFLVQLAGSGTYVASARAAKGGSYGAAPGSNPVGPDGGDALVDHTVEMLRSLVPAPQIQSAPAASPATKP